MERLRIGLLGAAGIAPRALIAPARSRADVEVVGVASRAPARARAFAAAHGIPRVFDDYGDMLASPDVDAVYVATPNSLHGRWAAAAIEAGKHVLCEKPFAANGTEARAVASRARRSSVVVMQALHYRYHPAIDLLLETLASGVVGTVQSVEVEFATSLGTDRDNIRWRLDLAGGAVMDVGCYALHLLRTLVGAEPTVRSATAHERTAGVDGDMTMALELPREARAAVRVSMWDERPGRTMSLVVTGDGGVVTATRPFIPHEGNELVVRTDAGERRVVTDPRSSYDFQLAAFADAVLRGGPVLTDVDDAVRTMDLVDAVYLAAGLPVREPSSA